MIFCSSILTEKNRPESSQKRVDLLDVVSFEIFRRRRVSREIFQINNFDHTFDHTQEDEPMFRIDCAQRLANTRSTGVLQNNGSSLERLRFQSLLVTVRGILSRFRIDHWRFSDNLRSFLGIWW